MLLRRSLAVAALVAVPACTTPGNGEVWGTSSPNSGLAAIPQHPHVALCPPAAKAHQARCFAHVRVDDSGKVAAADTPQGLGAPDLQGAYAIPTSLGAGVTVAIVDAQDDPNAESDLAVYRAQYGLPPCTTANGCFRKVDQNGGTSYPAADSDWGGEISLDLDMVSAVCPQCHILLVEANSTDTSDLGAGVNLAAMMGATAISNSYGGPEDPSDPQTDAQYYHHPGVLITASSGDDGYGVSFPASAPDVVGVGGTSLVQASGTARGWQETAWAGAGSGCSQYEGKPSWQTDPGCSERTVADVSAVADPNTGVAVYDSFGEGGWIVIGGTSAASPIVASVFAMTGMAAKGVQPLYGDPSLVYDVTSGSNGSCGGSYLCTAGPGYDGPTGLGTPNATAWSGGASGSGSSSSSSSGGGSGSSSGAGSSGSSGGSGGGSGSGGSSGGTDGGAGLQITLVSPDDGVTLPGNSQVTLVAGVASSAAVTQVVLDWIMPSGSVQVDCASPPSGTTCTQNGDEYTWSFTGTTGVRSWSVEATDADGNTAASETRTLTLDSSGSGSPSGPSVSFDSPSAGDSFSVGDSVTITVEADGPSGISDVWLDWSSAEGDQQYELGYVGGTQWSVTLPPISGAGGSGPRTLTVTAYDPSGATGSVIETINVQ